MAISKEEVKKDVNKYIRQSKKLDGNKSFKKTYVMDEDTSFMLELNGDKMKIALLFKGMTMEKTTIGDIPYFDNAWDSFIRETGRFTDKILSDYEVSFKEKMDEFIEMDELFEPFIVKNKENHDFDMEIELGTDIGYNIFITLFERCYGYEFSRLCKDFKITNLDRYIDEMGEYGTMILRHKDDERMTFMFDPTSRLGRFIVFLAMAMDEDMKMRKEE